jgi:hypothetical protein
MLRFALLAAMVVAMSCGPDAQADQEVYAKADEIIGRAEEAVASNLAAFIQANEAPLQTARSELATLIKEMNETGKQSLATSLQSRLNKLDETIQKRVITKVPIVEPPPKPLLERLEGTWDRHNGSHVRLFANGTAEYITTRNSKVGKGTLTEVSPHVASITWDSGYINHCRLAGDDAVVVFEWKPSGQRTQGFSLERMK